MANDYVDKSKENRALICSWMSEDICKAKTVVDKTKIDIRKENGMT